MKTFALITAALMLATRMAAATTLAAAPIFTGGGESAELCLVTNYSASAVKLISVQIINDQGNTILTLSQNTCTTAIASGASCRFAANIPQGAFQAYACVATTKASAKTAAFMRMTNEQLDSNGNGLYNEPGY
jgi:hypothetical protein